MKFLIILFLAFISCTEKSSLQPQTQGEKEITEQQENALDSVVEVNYQIKATENLAETKYTVNDSVYLTCGQRNFNFEFETNQIQTLILTGRVKSGQEVITSIYVDNKLVNSDTANHTDAVYIRSTSRFELKEGSNEPTE